MWSRKLKACRPTKVHLGIFRNRLLSDNMLTFRLAAGDFYLTYFLHNVVVSCTYFLKIVEHIIKWQFEKHFKVYSFPFLCNLLWEPGNNTKRCVSLTTSPHSQVWRGHREIVSSWVWRKSTCKCLSSCYREDLRLFAEEKGSDIRRSPQKACLLQAAMDAVPVHSGQCQTRCGHHHLVAVSQSARVSSQPASLQQSLPSLVWEREAALSVNPPKIII